MVVVVVLVVVVGINEVVVVSTVVVVVSDVVVVNIVDVVVVGGSHGQSKETGVPTAAFRHTRESVAVIGRLPLGAQMHSGVQVAAPTAALRMNKQSDATGPSPLLSG